MRILVSGNIKGNGNISMTKASDMSGESLTLSEKILVFTRVPSEGFDAFMGDPETVIATVEDMGFNQDDMLRAMTTAGDPTMLLQLMEGRWSGVEMNFSFENLWSRLCGEFPDSPTLELILNEGRHSQIHTEHAAIRVLSQDQVKRAYSGLGAMQMLEVDNSDEDDQLLGDLFLALQNFFKIATEAEEFILVSWI